MNIDEKLREILRQNGLVVNASDVIKATKQAFADEGYEKRIVHFDKYTPADLGFTELPEDYKVAEIMTGQDWYERFEKELSGKVLPYPENAEEYVRNISNEYIEAAKRASGLDS